MLLSSIEETANDNHWLMIEDNYLKINFRILEEMIKRQLL